MLQSSMSTAAAAVELAQCLPCIMEKCQAEDQND